MYKRKDNKMKKNILILSIILTAGCSYGQYPRTSISDTGKVVRRNYGKTETVVIGDGVTVTYKDRNGKLKTDYYGVAGIKKERVDSTKIYWKRYVKLRNKGIPDSLNPYKTNLK